MMNWLKDQGTEKRAKRHYRSVDNYAGAICSSVSLTGFLRSKKLNAHLFWHTHATQLIEG